MSSKTVSNAPGERNLQAALASLTTTTDPTLYVFVTVPISHEGSIPSQVENVLKYARLVFYEHEGVTLVLSKALAQEYTLRYEYPCRMITLNVQTSLELIGFMATISKRLTEGGISCNVVAGFYHDHLFVPEERVRDAVMLLADVAEEAKKSNIV